MSGEPALVRFADKGDLAGRLLGVAPHVCPIPGCCPSSCKVLLRNAGQGSFSGTTGVASISVRLQVEGRAPSCSQR